MKALGITAMIFAIVAIFVPIAGPYLTLICALLAAFSAGPGLTFGAVAILINTLNVAFLSPSLWLTAGLAGAGAEAEQAGTGEAMLLGMGFIFIGAQVVAAIVLALVHASWKKRQPKTTQQQPIIES
jgi:phosphoglycerol transferase MdoB-like AlkP superfamily enzyme